MNGINSSICVVSYPQSFKNANGAPLKHTAGFGDAGQEISVRFKVSVAVNTAFVIWSGIKTAKTLVPTI